MNDYIVLCVENDECVVSMVFADLTEAFGYFCRMAESGRFDSVTLSGNGGNSAFEHWSRK